LTAFNFETTSQASRVSWSVTAVHALLRHPALEAESATSQIDIVVEFHMIPVNLSFKRFPQFDKPLAVWDPRFEVW